MIDDVRNFLFENAERLNFVDLFSLNVQRGRDHGLQSYNAARISMGLEPYMDFDEYFPDDEPKARKF